MLFYKNLTISLTLLCIGFVGYSHNIKSDSLKLKEYFDISDVLIKKGFNDSAMYYNKLCEKILEKSNIPSFNHLLNHYYVRIYHAKADYKKALEYCLKSIEVAHANKNKFQEATTLRAIFNIYHNLNENDSAVKYAVLSQKLTQEIGDTANITVNYGNLCWLYMDLGKYDEAIKYGKMGVVSGPQYKDTVGWLISLNNLAQCYLQTNKNTEAIEILKKQYELGYIFKRPRSIRNALFNLGTIYYYQGNTLELDKTTTLLLAFNKEYPDIDIKNQCNQYIIQGFNFLYKREFEESEKILLEGLAIAEPNSLVDPLLTFYLTLSKVNYAKGDFSKGNFWEDKWDQLYQSTNEQHLSEFESELQTKYDVHKKQVTIELQEAKIREKGLLFNLSVVLIIALIIISILIFRNFRHRNRLQKQRIGELETEKQLAATEAVLKGEEQERTRLAKDLHDGLGGMLSGLKYSFANIKGNLVLTPENHQAFERGLDMLDSSIKEMRRVAHNLMPEALVRFGLDTALKDFCNEINLSGAIKINYQSIGLENIKIDQSVSITLFRIIQELVNNILKHSRACEAIVQLNCVNNLLVITVEDDGKGFDTQIISENKGIGLLNIKNRIEFLKGKWDIKSKPGEGTSFQLEIYL